MTYQFQNLIDETPGFYNQDDELVLGCKRINRQSLLALITKHSETTGVPLARLQYRRSGNFVDVKNG